MRKEYKTWPEYQQANSPRRDRRRKVIQVNNSKYTNMNKEQNTSQTTDPAIAVEPVL
jgi:hypothetical protein